MNRRLFRKWVVWLLPMVAARALLPTGFMLSVDAAGLHLAFCPTQSPALAEAFAARAPGNHLAHAAHADFSAHHAPADLAQGAGDASEAATIDAPCPYARAAAAMGAEVPRVAGDLPRLDDEFIAFRASHSPTTGPVRADRIRGPPSFS